MTKLRRAYTVSSATTGQRFPDQLLIKGSSGWHHIIPSLPEICKVGINLQAGSPTPDQAPASAC